MHGRRIGQAPHVTSALGTDAVQILKSIILSRVGSKAG
jgi:hypothetical protein